MELKRKALAFALRRLLADDLKKKRARTFYFLANKLGQMVVVFLRHFLQFKPCEENVHPLFRGTERHAIL